MNWLLYRYGRQLNMHDILKIIATILMVMDHVGIVMNNDLLRVFGRGSAPIFYFLIGFSGKLRMNVFLVIYGVILSWTWTTISGNYWVNILLTFVFLHYTLVLIDPIKQSIVSRVVGFAALVWLTAAIYSTVEYGLLGLLIGFSGRSVAMKERSADFWLATSLITFLIFQGVYLRTFANVYFTCLLLAIFTCMFFLLRRHYVRDVVWPKPLRLVALFVSRYSLQIYFYHWLILQLVFFWP